MLPELCYIGRNWQNNAVEIYFSFLEKNGIINASTPIVTKLQSYKGRLHVVEIQTGLKLKTEMKFF